MVARRDQLDNVQMTVGREPLRQPRENFVRIGVADVVEETVDENEIELPRAAVLMSCYVGSDEGPIMFSPGAFNVPWIDIDAEIVRAGEVLRICAGSATDVKHAPHLAKIIVLQHRRYLFRCKRRLPETVNHRLFKEKIYKAHFSTCTRLRSSSWTVECLGAIFSERIAQLISP